jgi:hypothetical protein
MSLQPDFQSSLSQPLPANMSNTHQERTLPEQVEFAYLTLLGHLEHLASRMQEMKDGPDEIDDDCLEALHEHVNRMLSKNFRLRFKINSINQQEQKYGN